MSFYIQEESIFYEVGNEIFLYTSVGNTILNSVKFWC